MTRVIPEEKQQDYFRATKLSLWSAIMLKDKLKSIYGPIIEF